MTEKHEGALEQTRRLLEAQNREAADASTWRALGLDVVGHKMVLPISDVIELAVCENITPVPLTQPWVRGLTNLRGQLYTVVDLSVFLGGEETRLSRDARIVLLADEGLNSCLLISGVIGLKVLHDEAPAPVNPGLDGILAAYFRHQVELDGERWLVLDVGAVLADQRFLDPSRIHAVTGRGVSL